MDRKQEAEEDLLESSEGADESSSLLFSGGVLEELDPKANDEEK